MQELIKLGGYEAKNAAEVTKLEKKLEKGNSQVATITYKQAKNEKKGKYVFFGFAAE